MILIIGQNPAKGFEHNPAFEGTKSGKRLFKWLKKAKIYNYTCLNIWQKSGKLPNILEVKYDFCRNLLHNRNWPYNKIVTVGKISDKVIKQILIDHRNILNIPHPSGLNRKLNDPKVEEQIIKDLREFVK